MLKILIPVIVAFIGVAGGVTIGVVLKPSDTEKESEEGASAVGEKGEKKGTDGAPQAEKDHHIVGLGDHAKATDSEYVPMESKLIAPFTRANGRAAFVAVDVTLEMVPGAGQTAQDHAPKIIAAFLRVVIWFASTGAFDDHEHAPHTINELNDELYKAAKGVLGEDVRGVLIANLLTSDA
jgi:hypothetical protein